jgi:hypothetical protein
MNLMRRITKPVARYVVCCFAAFSLSMPAARAEMIGTGAVLNAEQRAADIAGLNQLLTRADVQQRIDSLSDDELQSLTGQINSLPAGGDVLGVIVFLFLVLLVTDILGYTDIFPFVKHGSGRR